MLSRIFGKLKTRWSSWRAHREQVLDAQRDELIERSKRQQARQVELRAQREKLRSREQNDVK